MLFRCNSGDDYLTAHQRLSNEQTYGVRAEVLDRVKRGGQELMPLAFQLNSHYSTSSDVTPPLSAVISEFKPNLWTSYDLPSSNDI